MNCHYLIESSLNKDFDHVSAVVYQDFVKISSLSDFGSTVSMCRLVFDG